MTKSNSHQTEVLKPYAEYLTAPSCGSLHYKLVILPLPNQPCSSAIMPWRNHVYLSGLLGQKIFLRGQSPHLNVSLQYSNPLLPWGISKISRIIKGTKEVRLEYISLYFFQWKKLGLREGERLICFKTVCFINLSGKLTSIQFVTKFSFFFLNNFCLCQVAHLYL